MWNRLGWKKNLAKYQKVSKHYDPDCLQNFLLLFVSLLTAPIAKNIHILTGIYFIFLKKRPRPSLKVFQYQIWTSVRKSSYQVS